MNASRKLLKKLQEYIRTPGALIIWIRILFPFIIN